MMKFFSSVFSVLLFVLPASAEEICNFKTEKTNLRKGPSAKNFEIAAQLTNGHKLQVLERVTNTEGFEYLKVKYKNPNTGKTAVAFVYHEAVAATCRNSQSENGQQPATVPKIIGTNKFDRPFKPKKGDSHYSYPMYVDSFVVKIEILGRNKDGSISSARGGIIRKKFYVEDAQIRYRATIYLDTRGAFARDILINQLSVKGSYEACARTTMLNNGKVEKNAGLTGCFFPPNLDGSFFRMSGRPFELGPNNDFTFTEEAVFDAPLRAENANGIWTMKSIEDSEGKLAIISKINGAKVTEKRLYEKYSPD